MDKNENSIIITLVKNEHPFVGKKIRLIEIISFNELLAIASEVLNIDGKRIFKKKKGRSDGDFKEIDEISDINNEDILFVTEGEEINIFTEYDVSIKGSIQSKIDKNIESTLYDNYDIAIMGSAAVGKSTITIRYVQRHYVSDYNNTLEDKFTKIEIVDKKICQLDILDTSGEDDYIPLRSLWMKERHGFIFVFSIINRKTFEDLQNFERLYKITFPNQDIPVIIIGNKKDLDNFREVSKFEGQEFPESEYFETSAKTGENIDNAFITLIKKLRNIETFDKENSPIKVRLFFKKRKILKKNLLSGIGVIYARF